MLTPLRPRSAALLAAAAAGLVLSGCSFSSPDTSLQPYAPADGLQTEMGDVLVRNMLVVSEGGGEPGLLVGALVNRGQEDTIVQVEVADTSAEIVVPAGVSVVLGLERQRPDTEAATIVSERVEIDEVQPIAGDVIDLTVTEPSFGTAELRVLVALPEGQYAEFSPGR